MRSVLRTGLNRSICRGWYFCRRSRVSPKPIPWFFVFFPCSPLQPTSSFINPIQTLPYQPKYPLTHYFKKKKKTNNIRLILSDRRRKDVVSTLPQSQRVYDVTLRKTETQQLSHRHAADRPAQQLSHGTSPPQAVGPGFDFESSTASQVCHIFETSAASTPVYL